MKKKLRYSVFALGILTFGVAYAALSSQESTTSSVEVNSAVVVNFKALDQISLPLSTADFNTIKVKSKRVAEFTPPPSYGEARINELDGSVNFISFNSMPYTVPVILEDGTVFSIYVKPVSQPGKSYMLVDKTNHSPGYEAKESNSPYIQKMLDINKAVINDEAPDGFDSVVVPDAEKIVLEDFTDAYMRMVKIYKGSELNIEVYGIQNNDTSPLVLQERYFFQSGVRTVMLKPQVIQPKQAGYLFVIMNRGDQDDR